MSPSGRHPLVIALAVIVAAECVLMAVASAYLIIELLTATPTSFASAIALTVLCAAATVWLAFIVVHVVHVLRGSPWVRGATVVWQVLQIAVAVGAFQGFFARPDIGWLLLIPAIAVLVLLFTPPVLAATTRRD